MESKKSKNCNYCSRKGNTLWCGGCQDVFYCCKTCQRADWANHNVRCVKLKSTTKHKPHEDTLASKNPEMQKCCQLCSNVGNHQRCAGCKSVFYCSAKCQKSDWKGHKPLCLTVPEDVGTKPKRVRYNSPNRRGKNSARPISHRENVSQSIHPELYQRSDIGLLAYKEVQGRVGKIFPSLDVITNVKVITRTPQFENILVMRISYLGTKIRRHMAILEDCNGNEMSIFFYLCTEPEPYFHYSDITPGNYVCYINPRLHDFIDGDTGFRIDDRESVRIIKP